MVTRKATAIADDNETSLEVRQSEALAESEAHERLQQNTLQGDASTGLALLSEESIRRALEAAREMEMSFTEFTSLTELTKLQDPSGKTDKNGNPLPMPFKILDAVTIMINVKKPRPNEPSEKPVHIFVMEDANGIIYHPMCGVNPVRDRIASGFIENRFAGIRITAGPVVLDFKDTGQKEPAIVFRTLPGFKVERLYDNAPQLA